MPSMLALMAVQRQTATSRSRSPSSTEQHGWSGGDPTTAPIGPLSTLAHTPNLSASLGQLFVAGLGFGKGNVLGVGLGCVQVKQPLAMTKKSKLIVKKRASVEDLEDFIV
uniref:Uncharacterized protein n=1 Tax=Cajanus cajan TaxID=3821 RepID=A0A151R4X2_CAJCA|nr:hypothetical protein KK1_041125 [Cajanus cajan]